MASRLTAAIVLAGGTAARMGGVDKTALPLAGQSLVARTVAAARIACDGAVVVVGGNPDVVPGVIRTREQPAHGGPVAALAAGIAYVDAEWTLLLAGDLRDGARAVAVLTEAGFGFPSGGVGSVPSGIDPSYPPDAVVLTDPAGRPQWLCARVRTAPLRRALADIEVGGARLSHVFDRLTCVFVPDPAGVSSDIDTWQDLTRARARQHAAAASAPLRERRAPDQNRGGLPVTEHTLPPEALDEWAGVLRERFGLSADEVPIAAVLDLARDVAHDVARPAAPLSAFIAGFVAGRSGATPEAITETLAEIVSLAHAWATAGSDRDDTENA